MAQINYNRWLGRQTPTVYTPTSQWCRRYGNAYDIFDLYIGNVYRSDPSSSVTVRGISGFVGCHNEGWKGASQNRPWQAFQVSVATGFGSYGSGLSGFGANVAGVSHCNADRTLVQSALNNINVGVSGAQNAITLCVNAWWSNNLNNGQRYYDKASYGGAAYSINVPQATAPSKLSTSATTDMDKTYLSLTVRERGAFSTIKRVMYRIDGGSWVIYKDNLSPSATFGGEGKTTPLYVNFQIPRTFEYDSEHTYEFQVLNTNGLTANISGKWKQPRGITHYRQQTVKGSLSENLILNGSFDETDSNGDVINYWSNGTIVNSGSNTGQNCLSLTTSQAAQGTTYDFGELLNKIAITLYVKSNNSNVTISTDTGYNIRCSKYNSPDYERAVALIPSARTITIKVDKSALIDDISAVSTKKVGDNYIAYKGTFAKLDYLDPKAKFKYYADTEFIKGKYKSLISGKTILNLAQDFILQPVPQSVLSTLQHGQMIINQGGNLIAFISIEYGKYYLVVKNKWQRPSCSVSYSSSAHERYSTARFDLSKSAIINFIPTALSKNYTYDYQSTRWATVNFGNLAPYFLAKTINFVPDVGDYTTPASTDTLIDGIRNNGKTEAHATGISYWKNLQNGVNYSIYSNDAGTTTTGSKWTSNSLRFDRDIWVNLLRKNWNTFTIEVCLSNLNDNSIAVPGTETPILCNFQNGGAGIIAIGMDDSVLSQYYGQETRGNRWSRLKINNTGAPGNVHTRTFRFVSGGQFLVMQDQVGACFPRNSKTIIQPENNTVWSLGGNPDGSTSSRSLMGNIHGVRLYNRTLSVEEISKNQAIDKCRFDSGAFNKISLATPPTKIVPTNLNSTATNTSVTLTWNSTGAPSYQINMWNGKRWCFYQTTKNSITIPMSHISNLSSALLKVCSIYQTPSNNHEMSDFSMPLYLGDPPKFELTP